ncbi:HET-domain-containing protein [Plenodomus tracheiphilus IPT5]|uniref:HET-domain-containing protein n=1 Tax=Plenodomus tracheiphilus IPT5 TaxID=1408161 RepID=A0A6A7AR69_9PLEO|nr:HET-domain-containing protein [Plenodomus tracheiphilus IPT5]
MRLLHAKTFEFQAFEGTHVPKYAILSHRWEGEEISYHEMEEGTTIFRDPARRVYFDKIRQCCLQAIDDELDYVWIDTCCIDKSSSAELSEAINSMYQWYQKSTMCYAYLSDVECETVGTQIVVTKVKEGSRFEDSKWWTRGWTLQELIAPRAVKFFAPGPTGWMAIGTRQSLMQEISLRTRIDHGTLLGRDVRMSSVARRMSWASERETTRPEDLAYCLLGLFGVNMPLLYGEGTRAFLRLQEEIMKQSDDQTLLAWELDPEPTGSTLCGPLATSPLQFRGSGNLLPIIDSNINNSYSMTNKGLMIELPIVLGYDRADLGLLQCSLSGTYDDQVLLPLSRLAQEESSYYARDATATGPLRSGRVAFNTNAVSKMIWLKQNPEQGMIWRINIIARTSGFQATGYSPVHSNPSAEVSQANTADHIIHRFPSGCGGGTLLFAGKDESHVLVFIKTPSQPRERIACGVLYCPPAESSLQLSHAQTTLLNIITKAKSLYEEIHRVEHEPYPDTACTCLDEEWWSALPYHMILNPELEELQNFSNMTSSRSFEYLPSGKAIYAAGALEVIHGQHTLVVDIDLQDRKVDQQPFELHDTPTDISVDERSTTGSSLFKKWYRSRIRR